MPWPFPSDAPTRGIATIGNGSAVAGAFTSLPSNALKPYLPSKGAELDLLFGVKPGINYAAAIADYVDPAHAGTGGIDFLTDIAAILGQPRDQAWATFQGLSQARQQLLVNRAFLDFLIQVGKDFKNPSSPYFGQYARAYTAISTLFPAGYGYTDDSLSVDGRAAPKIATGRFNVAASVLGTQMGGDINIVGPGGGISEQLGTLPRSTTVLSGKLSDLGICFLFPLVIAAGVDWLAWLVTRLTPLRLHWPAWVLPVGACAIAADERIKRASRGPPGREACRRSG